MLRLRLQTDTYLLIGPERLDDFLKLKLGDSGQKMNVETGDSIFLELTSYLIRPLPVSEIREELCFNVLTRKAPPYNYPPIKNVFGALSLHEISGIPVIYVRESIWQSVEKFLDKVNGGGTLDISCYLSGRYSGTILSLAYEATDGRELKIDLRCTASESNKERGFRL